MYYQVVENSILDKFVSFDDTSFLNIIVPVDLQKEELLPIRCILVKNTLVCFIKSETKLFNFEEEFRGIFKFQDMSGTSQRTMSEYFIEYMNTLTVDMILYMLIYRSLVKLEAYFDQCIAKTIEL